MSKCFHTNNMYATVSQYPMLHWPITFLHLLKTSNSTRTQYIYSYPFQNSASGYPSCSAAMVQSTLFNLFTPLPENTAKVCLCSGVKSSGTGLLNSCMSGLRKAGIAERLICVKFGQK